ncbi:Lysophospholipase L1 [Actinokineospora alba]|uniref:Lysophospholipase L1 n=1 Tax=Actinokineospora alba TaxID=504798 RepID=A0A1H0UF29_9PSEU|nr:SGNH/GDSL hydrolase family protein [Actinokineospora alba]TDP65139.1 lysophospholipase L1-like esterase [Actinokineospora alba]SDH54956.1 Lysophospholipase L1 [Actinokineospora alba]SDP64759.1 Lysophospholipase L1 [Actinokineospora alba]
MRVSRSLVITLLTLLSMAGFAVPASAATGKYVALGDSYSSGLGAGSYGTSGSCKRSSNAYPQLWANSHSPSAFSFVACSGARTGDVLANQIGAVTADTALVTISIGGNDAGFASVMTDCNFGSDSTCVQRNQEAQNYARTQLPPKLDQVYSQIRTRAPNARVLVVGYPRMYKVPGYCYAGLSETKRSAINQSADVLADVTRGRAAARGFTFVDGRTAFAGHEICASGTRWINSWAWPVEESYHPNVAGQSGGYYAAVRAVTG